MSTLVQSVITAALAVSLPLQAALVIDSFLTDSPTITDTTSNGLGIWRSDSGPGILGGSRDLFVNKLAGAGAALIGVSGNKLHFSSGTATSGVGLIRWDGANMAPAIDANGLGGLDLTAGATGFVLNVIAATQPFQAVLTAYTDATNYTVLQTLVSAPGIYNLSFANFQSNGAPFGSGVDFSAVGALEFSLLGDATIGPLLGAAAAFGSGPDALGSSIDVSLGYLVAAAPEPASHILLLTGLALAAVARRRRPSNRD
jgi:hypothetical protein